MNLFVTDPEWGWWIVLYFFFGGIAAGAYFMSTLIELFGREDDRGAARVGYRIAFPLIMLCGVFLIVDLNRPAQFWHMLLKSEVVGHAFDADWPWSAEGWKLMATTPLLKYWSPMSIGAWAIALFGLCSFLSFVASLWPSRRIARILNGPICGNAIRIVGCAVGFFVAAYTGALLTATNQPVWSDTVWIASLFLTSATSTGIATLVLIGRGGEAVPSRTFDRLERADLWALTLELVVFSIFIASLGSRLLPILHTANGKLLVIGTLVFGLFIPLAIHLRRGITGRHAAVTAAVCVLIGGFVLRYAIVRTPSELLARHSTTRAAKSLTSFGPETDRRRGGGRGADPGNRPADLKPRSKVFGK